MGDKVKTGDVISALHRRARRELSDLANAQPVYRMAALAARPGDAFAAEAPRLRAGDAKRGAQIKAGRFTLCGETVQVETGESVWNRPAPSRRFAEALHGFTWMNDLLSLPESEEPLSLAQTLLDDWLGHFGGWNWFAWSPPIVSRRLRSLVLAGPALFEDEDPSARRRRMGILARHARRLQRALPLMEEDRDRLDAAISLCVASMCLELDPACARTAEASLLASLKAQVLPDGGHVSRSPEAAADLLVDLAIVEAAAQARGAPLSAEIRKAYDRIAPMVRFFQLAGGELAAFHGGGCGDPVAIKAAVKQGGAADRPFNFAPHSGYHRAEANGAVVIMDTGGPPPGAHAAHAHASVLAFELSAPGGRIVTNCGWAADQPGAWREAVRATAAHSALTLEETSSARLLQPGWRRQLLGPRVAWGPDHVKARRNEEDMGVWIEALHDGYREAFGLSVRRRLFLAADGGDLRGEDSLYRPVEDGPPEDPERRLRYAIRFHLHPDVRASLSRDSMSALLVLGNGDGWRFRTDGGPVRLERSVYLAGGAPPKRSAQLVVAGEAEPFGAGDRPPNRIRWAFQRLGRVGGAG